MLKGCKLVTVGRTAARGYQDDDFVVVLLRSNRPGTWIDPVSVKRIVRESYVEVEVVACSFIVVNFFGYSV